MTLYTISNGIDTSFSTKLNANASEFLVMSGLNTIRTLIDRVGVWAKGYTDGWGDAYTSVNGRESSVVWDNNNLRDTTAVFDTNKYKSMEYTADFSGDTTHDPDSMTNPSNAFDSNDTTYASKSFAGVAQTTELGKTFTSKYVYSCLYKIEFSAISNSTSSQVLIESYNGSTWSTIYSLNPATVTGGNSVTYSGRILVDATIQGLRVSVASGGGGTTSGTHRIYTFEYGTRSTYSTIKHTIPTGTFSSTISKAIGVPFIEDWETGANIQYKLTNASEDTDWLTYNIITSFTAFTSEPTALIVRLVAKSSSPTVSYPSIKGFWVRAT